ncbi:MAG: hypothetical protein HQL14_00705 [Candidatus Omnitrophica bacterium]|nr:hypothetical protein [Candidatus Omnitrophota bacterium]
MDKRCYQALGRQFYLWHRGNRIKFQYAGHSKDLELEVERVMGLIDYVEKKKTALAGELRQSL